MRSHLFISSFISFAIGDISVKMLLGGIPDMLMLSPRTFMVSWLIFKSFVHLKFILEYGVS